MNLNSRKYYRSFLTKTNLSSNIGLITDSINSTILLSNNIYLHDIKLYDTFKSTILITLSVFSSKNVLIIRRDYLKLQNVLSIMIPVMNTLIIFFKILLNPFTEKMYYENIISETISYKTLDNELPDVPSEIIKHPYFFLIILIFSINPD